MSSRVGYQCGLVVGFYVYSVRVEGENSSFLMQNAAIPYLNEEG